MVKGVKKLKELKFNLNYVMHKRELYFAFIAAMIISLVHIFLIIQGSDYIEFANTSEYLILPTNSIEDFSPILVLAFPVIGALIFSDSSWLDRSRKSELMFYTRLNPKKNIICRAFLSFAVTFVLFFIVLTINYLVLYLIFGSGIRYPLDQSYPFNISGISQVFLDELRTVRPILYALIGIGHVSILLGMLSLLSYCISFFVRQRLVIYFQVLLIMFVYEQIVSFVGFQKISIIYQLQLMSHFSPADVFVLYGILSVLSGILIAVIIKKEEIL